MSRPALACSRVSESIGCLTTIRPLSRRQERAPREAHKQCIYNISDFSPGFRAVFQASKRQVSPFSAKTVSPSVNLLRECQATCENICGPLGSQKIAPLLRRAYNWSLLYRPYMNATCAEIQIMENLQPDYAPSFLLR